jgi:hypothetical protein
VDWDDRGVASSRLARGAGFRVDRGTAPAPLDTAWLLLEPHVHPAEEQDIEARLAIGNGAFGMRAALGMPRGPPAGAFDSGVPRRRSHRGGNRTFCDTAPIGRHRAGPPQSPGGRSGTRATRGPRSHTLPCPPGGRWLTINNPARTTRDAATTEADLGWDTTAHHTGSARWDGRYRTTGHPGR